MNPVRLMVVDDHPLFRRGLVALLTQDERFVVLHEAADAGEAVRCVALEKPDLILLDNHLPGVRGVDAIAGLKEVAPAVKILMLTVSENESILKVLSGQSVVSPEMTTKLVAAFRDSSATQAGPLVPDSAGQGATAAAGDGLEMLSAREREILTLIARGASNKLIARDLDIAETTVKIHVQHILRKLNLSSRVQAAVYATGRGVS
jgi:two-component system nitrate/nitrite response regulator NarL